MHVLIDAIAARLGGNITVLRNLLSALVEMDGGRHRYTVFGRESLRSELEAHPRVHVQTASFAEWNTLARLAWEQVAIPAQSAFGEVDLVFAPSGLAVFAAARPQVVMFQNAAPFDEDVLDGSPPFKRLRLQALRTLGIASARAADRVVFISKFQRELLLPKLGIPAAKSRTIYPGHDPAFSPAAKARTPEILQRYGISAPYLLSVSHFYHYKNIVELVQGFALAMPSLPQGMRLVLAGAEQEEDYSLRVRKAVEVAGVESRVDFLGNVPHGDLPPLYAGAEAFVFPSQCESFPNILVEGMASGAPTLASSAGPMPELAQKAAQYFDGRKPADIASSLIRLMRDPALGRELARRGIAQAAHYSWRETARELLELFEEIAPPSRAVDGAAQAVEQRAKTSRYFGQMADTWGDRYSKANFGERRDIVSRWLTGGAPGLMADVGCGSGPLSVVPRQLGWRVVGLDLSRNMLQAARTAGLREVVASDAARLPLRSQSVDAILCISALEYVAQPAEVIAEFARCLKPRGLLLLSIPNQASLLRRLELAVAGVRKRSLLPSRLSARLSHLEYLDYAKTKLSDTQLEAMLQAAGFTLASIGHFTPAGMPGSRLQLAGMNTYAMAIRR